MPGRVEVCPSKVSGTNSWIQTSCLSSQVSGVVSGWGGQVLGRGFTVNGFEFEHEGL